MIRSLAISMIALAPACGTSVPPRDGGHDASRFGIDAAIASRDAYFGDTNASDSGPCTSRPTYADVSSAVFVPHCALAGCHSRASPEPTGGLVLDEASSRAQLLGGSSYPGIERVIPGDVTHSLLWRKLTNDLRDESLGQPMPLAGSAGWIPITPSELELVRCWIASGAM